VQNKADNVPRATAPKTTDDSGISSFTGGIVVDVPVVSSCRQTTVDIADRTPVKVGVVVAFLRIDLHTLAERRAERRAERSGVEHHHHPAGSC